MKTRQASNAWHALIIGVCAVIAILNYQQRGHNRVSPAFHTRTAPGALGDPSRQGNAQEGGRPATLSHSPTPPPSGEVKGSSPSGSEVLGARLLDSLMPRLYDPNPLFTGLKSVEEDIRDWEQTCEGFVKAGDRPSLAQAVSDKAMRIPEEERDVFLEGLAQLYWSEYCQGISDGADPGRMTYRLAMAEEALTLLHKLFPDNAGYYRLRSEIAFEKNETKKSLDYAEEGISVLRPKLPKAGLRLADQLKPVGNDGQMEVVPLNFSAAGQKETAFQSARYISVYSMYRLVLLKAQALERLGRAQARKEALEGFRNTLRGIGLAQTVMAQRVEELLSK